MRVPKWAKRLWEGWHHLDAARALFQFVREWLWVVFAVIKWGGGVGTIGISVLLLAVGWVSGLWFWLLISGAVLYTTAIPAFAIMQSRRAAASPIRQTSAPPQHPAHMGGTVEPVYVPEDHAKPSGVLGPNVREIGVGRGPGDPPTPELVASKRKRQLLSRLNALALEGQQIAGELLFTKDSLVPEDFNYPPQLDSLPPLPKKIMDWADDLAQLVHNETPWVHTFLTHS